MILENKNSNNTLVWIDLFQPSAEEIKKIEKQFDVKFPQSPEIEEITHLKYDDKIMILCIPDVVPMDSQENPQSVILLIKQKMLFTLRNLKLRSFEAAKTEVENSTSEDGFEIFSYVINQIVTAGGKKLQDINFEITFLSKKIFFTTTRERNPNIKHLNKKLRSILYTLGIFGEQTSQIREIQLGLQRIIAFVTEETKDKLSENVNIKLATIERDLKSLTNFEDHLTNRIQFLLDAILGFINIEQNDIFKVLTIVSVVGIPPTFIASWYGMNFHYIPEITWIHGYFYVSVVTALSIIVPMIWFKWRGWW